jgi:hypothetical protein
MDRPSVFHADVALVPDNLLAGANPWFGCGALTEWLSITTAEEVAFAVRKRTRPYTLVHLTERFCTCAVRFAGRSHRCPAAQ